MSDKNIMTIISKKESKIKKHITYENSEIYKLNTVYECCSVYK